MVSVLRAVPAALLVLATAGSVAVAQQPAAPATTGPRLAWINSQEILANTPGRAEAESLFNREMDGMRAEVQRLQTQLDSAVAEYNRASAAMTPAAKAQREDQLRQLEARNRQRAQELDQQAQDRQQELTAPIMQRVNAVIEGIRAEFNYAFVFDVAAQGNPIITADRSLDITRLVIQRLQAAGPPPGPTPAGQNPPPLAAPQQDSTRAPADTTRPAQPAGPRVRPRP